MTEPGSIIVDSQSTLQIKFACFISDKFMNCQSRPDQQLSKSSRHLFILQRIKLLLDLFQYHMENDVYLYFPHLSGILAALRIQAVRVKAALICISDKNNTKFGWGSSAVKTGSRLIIGLTFFKTVNVTWISFITISNLIELDLTKLLTASASAELHKLLKLTKKEFSLSTQYTTPLI